ncbi:MAG: N-acetylmuramoyl-L-alanine amidase [Phycisphaerales bacterium]|nr:N-acetylmuramoyl-L-alanine amidase [Phycisphaerales bacterium]
MRTTYRSGTGIVAKWGGRRAAVVAGAMWALANAALPGCAVGRPAPGTAMARQGDEIVVCGQLFHTGAPVVLWTDPGGYDAYRTEKRFVPWEGAAWSPGSGPETPNRYGLRRVDLSKDEFEQVRGGGWDLATLRRVVSQFVIHYDVCGTSRQCFRVLHDVRGLSVHFMLDIDGTIYQTLDVKERAWHATTSNDCGVGIEIANIGAYPVREDGAVPEVLAEWYGRDDAGPFITLPEWMGDGGVRTAGFVGRPSRAEMVVGEVQGSRLAQYDMTDAQYDSLIKLTATLCTVLPRIECDYPRNDRGELVRAKLDDAALAEYRGLIGHFHITENKTDPGPAFDWERVVRGAKELMETGH